MITHEASVRVRYVETDAMGIVHHSNYLVWFELARVEMMDILGLPYRKLEEQDCLLAVLESHVRYIKPSFFDDRLRVIVYVREKPRVRTEIEYEVLRKEELLATGKTSHAFINRQGHPIKPPEVYVNAISKHFGKA